VVKWYSDTVRQWDSDAVVQFYSGTVGQWDTTVVDTVQWYMIQWPVVQ